LVAKADLVDLVGVGKDKSAGMLVTDHTEDREGIWYPALNSTRIGNCLMSTNRNWTTWMKRTRMTKIETTPKTN
jgi:hypothetical protein